MLNSHARKEVVAPIAGTWAAFCLALLLAVPQPPNPLHIAVGAMIGALMIFVGFSVTFRYRPRIIARTSRRRAWFAALSLLAGTALAGFLLTLLVALSQVEPAVRSRFAGRISEPTWRPWALAFESSVLEEVVFRLFVMSIVAWFVVRVIKRPRAATVSAFVVSTLLFGLAHVPAWISAGHTPPVLVVAVLFLNGIGGVLLGLIFWRGGLVYAILCHFAGDVIIQSLGPKLLA